MDIHRLYLLHCVSDRYRVNGRQLMKGRQMTDDMAHSTCDNCGKAIHTFVIDSQTIRPATVAWIHTASNLESCFAGEPQFGGRYAALNGVHAYEVPRDDVSHLLASLVRDARNHAANHPAGE